MDTFIYGIVTVLYILLLGYGVVLWRKDAKRGPRYFLFLVTAALVWDNGVMAAGNWIGEGELLKGLNLARFWLHAFCTPLLVVVAFDLIRRAGSPWARSTVVQWGAWIVTAALIIMQLVTETIGLKMKPVQEFGALRYVPAGEHSGPPIMIIIITVFLFVAGIILWKRKITSVLFWGTLLMVAGTAIPIPIDSKATTNVFELVLIASLWISMRRLLPR
ncbi:hypothetical protein [Paenibacillus vini]|uniref:Phospholipid phosphatase n=1 Tax=Paenibacillus vini TaxID=1476024 RepID=A0ABQ4M5I1_9BACL|nr:hypothetical protein [Paenibacillus vini]GIP51217.1 hypothetical protein J42TS3_02520 [Paenibacillus vini]